MKNITTILLVLIIGLSSCNPFLTPELRKKNRCNRKLERVVSKCPDLVKSDTITLEVEVEVPKLEIRDSIVLQVEIDSVTVDSLLNYINTLKTQKERVKTIKEYVLKSFILDTTITDSLYSLTFKIDNGVFSHDIVINEQKLKQDIKIEQQTFQKIKLNLFEKLLNFFGSWIWIIIIGFIIWLLFRLLKKYLL